MRLIQIITFGFEGLFNFEDRITDEQIESFYEEFEESEHDDFEEFMNNVHDNVLCERVFVDEVYV